MKDKQVYISNYFWIIFLSYFKLIIIIHQKKKQMQKAYLQTPSTAHKRYSNQNTGYKASPQISPYQNQNRRNLTNTSSKIQSLKQSIDNIIGSFKQKSSLQKGAIQRVSSTNTELNSFMRFQIDDPMTQSYKTSGFRQNPLQNEVKSEFAYQSYLSQKYMISEQNLKLQQKLNRQMRSNNNLIKSVHEMEIERKNLKNKSIQYNGRFSSNVQDQQQLIDQNRRLKMELNQLNSSYSRDVVSMSQFMKQFQKLKDQNQKLRRQTVKVFKM